MYFILYKKILAPELESNNDLRDFNYDHLGSVRVVYNVVSSCNAAPVYRLNSMSDYYAFGKLLRNFNGNKYGYQGSEKNTELGDNDYYTHFRGLDVEVARWKGVDPVYQPGVSPYISMDNNPVSNIDPLGDCVPCLEAVAVVGEIATAYREAKGARSLISILKGVKSTSSPTGEITLDGRDLSDPIVLFTKKNSPDLYNAYLLNRYHPEKYVTTELALESIQASRVLNATNTNTNSNTNTNQSNGQGKGKNKLEPNKDAEGDHSTFQRDNNGKVYKYETYKKIKNPKGDTFFDKVKRYDGGKPDGTAGASHNGVPTPHVQPKGEQTRLPTADEIPH